MLDDTGYADPRELLREAFGALLPPSRDTIDEFAALHRLIPRKSGTGYEHWAHETAPFLVAPMRAAGSLEYLTTCLVGPGGCGKTAVAENALLHAVEKQPRNFLWYMQNEAALEAYVKTRINPMVRVHEKEMLSRLGDKPVDDTLHFKNFVAMWIEFLAANEGNLISKRAPFIVLDEIDAFDPTLGDVKALADVRRARFGALSMILALSHPDLATGNDPVRDWNNGVMKIFADSTRCIWWWPCAECGRWSSPAPFAKRAMLLDYPHDETLDVIEREAHLLCPVNSCRIKDRQIAAMNLAAYRSSFGGYLGIGQEIDADGTVHGELIRHSTAGYFITGTMSPFLLKGIGGLARELAKAEKEFEVTGDQTTLKEVTVKQLGYLFSTKGPVGSIDAATLADRALSENYWVNASDPRVVPDGVRFLSCWIDVQVAHFEVLVRGWGLEKESWVIDKSRIPADTATDAAAWYNLLEGLLRKRWPLQSDAAKGMGLRALGFDSQGAPGTWDRAGEVWRKLRTAGLARNYGVLDGRDVWSVIPTQGTGRPDAPRLRVNYPDNQRKDKKQAARGNVPVAQFQPDQFKDNLAGQLRHAMPGPGYVHIPAALRSKESPHVNFEQLVSEVRGVTGRWTKPHQGVRNEMLDLMVGNHVLAHLHGLARINWASPPAWAAEHEKNTDVVPLVSGEAVAGQTDQPLPSAGPARRTIGDIMGKKKP